MCMCDQIANAFTKSTVKDFNFLEKRKKNRARDSKFLFLTLFSLLFFFKLLFLSLSLFLSKKVSTTKNLFHVTLILSLFPDLIVFSFTVQSYLFFPFFVYNFMLLPIKITFSCASKGTFSCIILRVLYHSFFFLNKFGPYWSGPFDAYSS